MGASHRTIRAAIAADQAAIGVAELHRFGGTSGPSYKGAQREIIKALLRALGIRLRDAS